MDEAVPRGIYSMALHIYDQNGTLVQTADYGLPTENIGCLSTHISVNQLAAGDYTLYGFVYAWETGERLPLLSDQEFSERGIMLGAFRVE